MASQKSPKFLFWVRILAFLQMGGGGIGIARGRYKQMGLLPTVLEATLSGANPDPPKENKN